MAHNPMAASDLHALVDELWSDKGYETRNLAQTDRALAHTTLDKFLARQDDGRIVASELPIRFELPEARLRLRGKIDALIERPDGVEIRDFKTGRTHTDREKLDKRA